MLEVVEENRALHEELKRSVVEEIMHAGVGTAPAVPSSTSLPVSFQIGASNTRETLNHFDHGKWRTELVNINQTISALWLFCVCFKHSVCFSYIFEL